MYNILFLCSLSYFVREMENEMKNSIAEGGIDKASAYLFQAKVEVLIPGSRLTFKANEICIFSLFKRIYGERPLLLLKGSLGQTVHLILGFGQSSAVLVAEIHTPLQAFILAALLEEL